MGHRACCSGVEYLPSIPEALGLNPSRAKKDIRKTLYVSTGILNPHACLIVDVHLKIFCIYMKNLVGD